MGGLPRTTAYGPAEYFDLTSDDGRPAGAERPAALEEPRSQIGDEAVHGGGLRARARPRGAAAGPGPHRAAGRGGPHSSLRPLSWWWWGGRRAGHEPWLPGRARAGGGAGGEEARAGGRWVPVQQQDAGQEEEEKEEEEVAPNFLLHLFPASGSGPGHHARARGGPERARLHSACRAPELGQLQEGCGVRWSGGNCSLHERDGQVHRGEGHHGGGIHPQERTAEVELVR